MMRSVIRPASIALLAAAVALPAATMLPSAAMARKHKAAADKGDDKGDDDSNGRPARGSARESGKDGAKDGGKDGAKEAGKPVEVGTFGDWGAYLAKGKGKTCYALAKPRERTSEGRKPEGRKDAAYVFIADRPGEKVHNEVSIMMGFPIKESGAAQALVGKASFDLVAKGSNAWIKNPDEEAKFVEALQHSAKLVVKAPPVKGPLTVDSYSLAGLKQALAQVGKDCR